MAFNGSGVFNRIHNWVADRTNSINITASRFDTEQDGIASGLTNCVTKDGQTTITANLKMSSKKHTGVAPASARDHYLDVAAAQDGKIYHAVTVGSDSDSVILTLFPTVTAYVTGMEVRWISSGSNTGSANLAVDGLSLTRLVTGTSSTLIANQIPSAAMVAAIYQGPGLWALQTPSETFNNLTVAGSANIGGAVSVGGAMVVTGATDIGGAVSCATTMLITGATNIEGAVSVGGALTVTGAVSCADTVTITGAVSMNSTLKVAGVLTMGANSVKQAELKTTTGDLTTTATSSVQIGAGGDYGFWPTIKSSGAGTRYVVSPMSPWTQAGVIAAVSVASTLKQLFYLGSDGADTLTVRSRYVQASPPYDMGDGPVHSFFYAIINNSTGLVESYYHAPDPPWANNGPTNIRPDRIDSKTGKQYKTLATLNPDLKRIMDADFLQETEVEITTEFKNSDMSLIPHPFGLGKTDKKSIVLLDPMSTVVERLETIKNAGGDAAEIIYGNYLNIGNSELGRGRPDGVMSVSVAMK